MNSSKMLPDTKNDGWGGAPVWNRHSTRLAWFLLAVLCHGAGVAPSLRGQEVVGIYREVFTGIGGTTVSDLTNAVSFPNSPAASSVLTNLFEIPVNSSDNYGQRLRAVLVAPFTGDYTFYICSDDQGLLYLSTTEAPVDKRLIAVEPEWNDSRNFTGTLRRTNAAAFFPAMNLNLPANRSDHTVGLIQLTAGQRYYVEVLMKEGGGGDNLAVAWRRPNGSGGFVFEGPIPATHFRAVGVRDPRISVPPLSQNRRLGQSMMFNVTAAGTAPFTYQWWKDGAPLPGATATTLSRANLQASDAGNYAVVVTGANGSVTSVVAELTVDRTTLDPAFNPGANDIVRSLVTQPGGMIMVGGHFTTLGGQPRNRLARLNPNGSLDPGFNPGASGPVGSMVLQADGKILVGGSFTNLAGQTRNRLARLNPDGTLDPTFNPGANATVYSLMLQTDGKILVSGPFTAIAGQSRFVIARLHPNGTLDTSFNAGANSTVISLALQNDGKILVGGIFTTMGGQARNRLARLNPNGTLDLTFNPGPGANDWVYAQAVQADGKILVGGLFTTMGGQARSRIARLNPDGTLDLDFNPQAGGAVSTLALQADGKILVGGSFTMMGGQPRNQLARLNPDGSLDSGFNPGANGAADSQTLLADGKILVGGNFTALGGQTRNRIALLHNTEPATQGLSHDGTTITWLRGGTSPEVWRTAFERSLDGGQTWTVLGDGTRVSGGWQLAGIAPVAGSSLRARGWVASGHVNASGWFVDFYSQPPTVLANPASQTNNVGTTARLSAVVGGSEPLAYQWFKNGTPLVDGDTVSGATRSELTLTAVSAGDAGGYYLTVSNSFGRVTSAVATLTVQGLAILAPPLSQTRDSGQSVTFDVTATGALPLSYQWRRDGLLLAGATEATLTLPSVTAKDAGEYTVEVGDTSGRVLSTAALLEVRVPPSIVSPPLARTLVKGGGQPLRLEVSASGTAPFSYQWLWNGMELTGFTSAVLEIASPEPFHSGSYAARVSNAAGATTSAAAAVRVIESARLARGPASQAVFPGARVELSVEALGTAPFTYQWKQNGQNIPGATNATYVIESVGLADAGTYTVAVANEAGALLSDPAELLILLPPAPPGDNFAQRVTLPAQASGTITSTNTFATRETNEPLHAGQPGARSVWFTWTAPATGQVTFDTIGSAFDTLLAVYAGTQLNALTELASDDDHGGFFTSEARFNAVAGTTYVIAVDGLGGESGRLVLSWSLQAAPLLPVITQQPASATVLAGAGVTLQVRADNAAVFQWRFNGANIPGASGADLTLPNVTAAQVGAYDVLISGGGATIRSREAVVEIGSDPNVRSYDKLEELLGLPVIAPALQGARTAMAASLRSAMEELADMAVRAPAALGAPPALVVSAGLPRTQIIDNTTATTQQREASHCGVIGYHSRWLAVRPESGGTLVIHAPGAAFPVVLALYTSGRLGDPAVACATNGPLRFPAAIAGRVYYLAVDGLNGVVGKIPIECRVGDAPPPPVAPPVRQTFTSGTRVTLNAPAIQVPDATYQWLHNDVPLPGGTGSEWELLVRTPQDAGVYSVVIDNGIGRVTHEVARVAVNAPLGLAGTDPADAPRLENGQFRFGLRGNAGQLVTVEQSAGLTAWDEVAALWLSAEGRGEHRDTAAGGAVKFYRAREVPLRLESAGDVTKANALHRAARVRGGQLGRRYVLEQSVDGGATWQPLRINTVQAADFQFEFPATLNATHRVRVLEEE